MKSRILPIFAVLTALGSAPAAADTTGMCLDRRANTEAQCTCATEALAAEIGDGELALYDAVGTRYLDAKADGQPMADAWDAAIAATATESGLGSTELLARMNDAGKAHRDAIRGCK